MKKKVYITLENGKVFEGISFGAEKEVVGEPVFTTGMVGYLETLTDPNYYGQIVAHTFPLIGNYGVIPSDFVSEQCWLKAYIVREKCDTPSNFRCEKTLEEYLKAQGIPAVYGVDTRELTKIIRENGVMNAAITFKPFTDLAQLKSYCIENAVEKVTERRATEGIAFEQNEGINVAVYNFGNTKTIVDELISRGCNVTVVPTTTTAEEIINLNCDGLMLADGPSDPAQNQDVIKEVQKLVGKMPIFGINLGHEVLALAMGGQTRKMKYGHRGANQPVKCVKTGRVFITAQNHGYEVVANSLPCADVTFINGNDGSCEGLDYLEYNAFSLQFHPTSSGGPHDATFLYDEFVTRMKKAQEERK